MKILLLLPWRLVDLPRHQASGRGCHGTARPCETACRSLCGCQCGSRDWGPRLSPPLESPGEHDNFFDKLGVGPSQPLEPSDDHDNPLTAPTMTGAGPSEDLPP